METNSFLSKNWKNILLIVFFFVIIALVMSTTCANRKLDVADNNLKAMTDTLRTYELKNGELFYAKQGYITKLGELETFIGVKEKEIKELEKNLKSKVATISKLQEQIRLDSLQMNDSSYITHDTITNDTVYHGHFNYYDNWTALDGETTFRFDPFKTHTIINSLRMEVPLKVGTTADNQWFATSDNPHVYFTSVEGVNLEKAKQKRWTFGIQGGLGLVGGVGLVGTQFSGISTANTGAGWFVGAGGYIGFGFTYKLFEF